MLNSSWQQIIVDLLNLVDQLKNLQKGKEYKKSALEEGANFFRMMVEIMENIQNRNGGIEKNKSLHPDAHLLAGCIINCCRDFDKTIGDFGYQSFFCSLSKDFSILANGCNVGEEDIKEKTCRLITILDKLPRGKRGKLENPTESIFG